MRSANLKRLNNNFIQLLNKLLVYSMYNQNGILLLFIAFYRLKEVDSLAGNRHETLQVFIIVA